MASNLFLLKGWTITLIAALFALSAKDANKAYVLIAFLALLFWVSDRCFLSQERRFRALYDQVRTLDETQVDFSMDTAPFRK
jgi:chromatin segregation and condensation protein Rec8/ScpA/Scc1 (kleisin family)